MIKPGLSYERAVWQQNLRNVAGVDEVGRGAWAGPLVAAAVVLHPHTLLEDEELDNPGNQLLLPSAVRDSKKVLPSQRPLLADRIKRIAMYWTIGIVDVEEINQVGIGVANELGLQRALDLLPCPIDHVFVDGRKPLSTHQGEQTAVVGGDNRVASIAAASIVAKVYRDNLMAELGREYPEYRLAQHKGYGTKLHQVAITKYGLSPIHRTSYKLKFLQQ